MTDTFCFNPELHFMVNLKDDKIMNKDKKYVKNIIYKMLQIMGFGEIYNIHIATHKHFNSKNEDTKMTIYVFMKKWTYNFQNLYRQQELFLTNNLIEFYNDDKYFELYLPDINEKYLKYKYNDYDDYEYINDNDTDEVDAYLNENNYYNCNISGDIIIESL